MCVAWCSIIQSAKKATEGKNIFLKMSHQAPPVQSFSFSIKHFLQRSIKSKALVQTGNWVFFNLSSKQAAVIVPFESVKLWLRIGFHPPEGPVSIWMISFSYTIWAVSSFEFLPNLSVPLAFTHFYYRRWWRTAIWTLSNPHGFTQSTNDKRCCPISPTPSSPEQCTVCTLKTWPRSEGGSHRHTFFFRFTYSKAINGF